MKKLVALFGFVLVFSAFSHRANAACPQGAGQYSISNIVNATWGAQVCVTAPSDSCFLTASVNAPGLQLTNPASYPMQLPFQYSGQWYWCQYATLNYHNCAPGTTCTATVTAVGNGQNVQKTFDCTRYGGCTAR